jgi:prevent-host-death family protein
MKIAVIISLNRYQELKRLEDTLYGKAAQLVIKEGLAPESKVDNLLAKCYIMYSLKLMQMKTIIRTIMLTEARQNFSSVITNVGKHPIVISKRKKKIAVILSSRRYQELKRLEDILFGEAAQLVIKEGLAP